MSVRAADASSTREAVQAGLRVLRAARSQPLERFLALGADALLARLEAWPALVSAAPFAGFGRHAAVADSPMQRQDDEPRARARVTAEATATPAGAATAAAALSVQGAKPPRASGSGATPAPVVRLRAISQRDAPPSRAASSARGRAQDEGETRAGTQGAPMRVALHAIAGSGPRASGASADAGPQQPVAPTSSLVERIDDERAHPVGELIEEHAAAQPAGGEAARPGGRPVVIAASPADEARSLVTIASLAGACMR